jgi:hypothetical protein
MNEHIKELAIEAKLIASEPNGFDQNNLSKSQQKFAELIVRECANHCDLLLDHKINSEWSRGTHDCSKAIKKHFGVKE